MGYYETDGVLMSDFKLVLTFSASTEAKAAKIARTMLADANTTLHGYHAEKDAEGILKVHRPDNKHVPWVRINMKTEGII